MSIGTITPLIFKKGISTDLTMGHLVEISKETPSSWWSLDKASEADTTQQLG